MKRIAATLVVLSIAGCATWSTSSVDTSNAHRAPSDALEEKNAADIVVTEGDATDRQYESLGDITVTVNKTTLFHPEPTPELVNERLQKRAAKLGADAVILVRYGKGGVSFVSWGSLEGKGRAIRYID